MQFFSHADGSTFVLPDLRQYFSYLSSEHNTTDEEFSCLLYNLDRHTTKVKAAFASIIIDMQRDIEKNNNLKAVINCLKAYDKSLLLSNCATVGDIFDKILDYFSFFDFEVIKLLTRIASEKTVKKFKKYKAMFKEYSKRRVVECPSDAFGNVRKSEKVYNFKVDKILNSLKTDELKRLHFEINKILPEHKLRLLQVEEGCVQLTFRGFENFSFTEEQQQALRNVGVLSISYGDKLLDISKMIFSEQNIKCKI